MTVDAGVQRCVGCSSAVEPLDGLCAAPCARRPSHPATDDHDDAADTRSRRCGGRTSDRATRRSSCIATRRRSLLGRLADGVRARKHPDGVVTYIIDRNVNYTNVCVAQVQLLRVLPPRRLAARATCSASTSCSGRSTRRSRSAACQLLLQGGHNPDLPLDLVRGSVPRDQGSAIPTFKLHALSPPEVIHLSRLSQLPVPEVIERLIAAGLDSIPGGGAEILVDRVRKAAALLRQGDRRRMARRHAPRAPRRPAHDGDDDVRDGGDATRSGSSTCCGCASCRTRPAASPRSSPGATSPITPSSAGAEATGIDYLRTLAIARIVLDNFDNLQASWVTQGGKVGQLSLAFGANDMGSVMIEENVVRAAGASYCMDEVEIVRNIEDAGFVAEAAQHALRDPRRSDLPRARRCRGCSSSRPRARTATRRCRRSCATIRRAAASRGSSCASWRS